MDGPVRESYAHWLYMALGFKYVLLLSLSSILGFVLSLIVVARGRGPLAGAALVFIVPMPFFIGVYGAVDGMIAMYSLIAASTMQPRPSHLAQGISLSLAAPLIGTLLMAPAYLVATVGLFVRSLAAKPEPAEGYTHR